MIEAPPQRALNAANRMFRLRVTSLGKQQSRQLMEIRMSEQMLVEEQAAYAEQAADIAAYRDGIRSDLAYVARQIRLARECQVSMKVHDCLARAADAMERLADAIEQPIG